MNTYLCTVISGTSIRIFLHMDMPAVHHDGAGASYLVQDLVDRFTFIPGIDSGIYPMNNRHLTAEVKY